MIVSGTQPDAQGLLPLLKYCWDTKQILANRADTPEVLLVRFAEGLLSQVIKYVRGNSCDNLTEPVAEEAF